MACQVIAPALTPRRPGQRIKTDKRDAKKLVRLFRAGELTAIRVPGEAEEGVRDFVRGREDVRRDVLRWRHRVVKFLDRHGRRYLAGRNWTGRHWTWLRSQRFEVAALQRTLEVSLFTLEQALARQAELDREIEALAQTDPYREPVAWLGCFRGIAACGGLICRRGPWTDMSVLSGVDHGSWGQRLESPRRCDATPAPGGATRAPRQRQLPTNHGHAALPSATRGYQPDSSSKPPLGIARRRPQENLRSDDGEDRTP